MPKHSKASELLASIAELNDTSGGLGRVRTISDNPIIAVGYSGDRELPYALILSMGLLSSDIQTEGIKATEFAEIELEPIDGGPARTCEVSFLAFRSVGPGTAYFIDAIVDAVLGGQTQSEIVDLVEDLIDLFRVARPLGVEEIVGFYGELLILTSSTDADALVSCWHGNPENRYDFASSKRRIEVKTTLEPRRIHHFSSSQLPAPPGVEVIVASFMTDEVPDGETVFDIYERVSQMPLSPENQEKLSRLFHKFVKKDFDRCLVTTFDTSLGQASLHFYGSEEIPAVQTDEKIIRASWEVDLTAVPNITSKNFDPVTWIRAVDQS